MKATDLALTSYLIPIVAVAVGAILFGEPLRARLLLGSVLVLAGVALVGRRGGGERTWPGAAGDVSLARHDGSDAGRPPAPP
jgi:drug/metabolite transporter (DMT)-like permease